MHVVLVEKDMGTAVEGPRAGASHFSESRNIYGRPAAAMILGSRHKATQTSHQTKPKVQEQSDRECDTASLYLIRSPSEALKEIIVVTAGS